MRNTKLPPEIERGIVQDYVCTRRTIPEIAAKWGISVNRVASIRKRHGVRRYMTRKLMGAIGASPDKEPTPMQRRCEVCQGLEVLAAPHQHGAAA